jgi:hypothetical protein
MPADTELDHDAREHSDAVVAIYAQVCAKLADLASVAEELLAIAPAADRPLLSASVLAAHGRALTQSRLTWTRHRRRRANTRARGNRQHHSRRA